MQYPLVLLFAAVMLVVKVAFAPHVSWWWVGGPVLIHVAAWVGILWAVSRR